MEINYDKQYKAYRKYLVKNAGENYKNIDFVLDSNLNICLCITKTNDTAYLYALNDKCNRINEVGKMIYHIAEAQSSLSISSLRVKEGFQKNGFGSALITYAKNICKHREINSISLMSYVTEMDTNPYYTDEFVNDDKDTNFQFYKNNGFHQFAYVEYGLRPMTLDMIKQNRNEIDIPTIYKAKKKVSDNLYAPLKEMNIDVYRAIMHLNTARRDLDFDGKIIDTDEEYYR